MEESQSWISVAEIIAGKTDWTTLLVAIIAGLIGAYGNYWVWSRQAAAERRSIRASLLAEIRSMLRVLEKREYLQHLKDRYTLSLQNRPGLKNSDIAMDGNVQDTYNLVFQANVSRLGALTGDEAAQVVQFHHLIQCLLADMQVGGPMREGSTDPELWKEGIEILEEAIGIGEGLLNKQKGLRRLWTQSGR